VCIHYDTSMTYLGFCVQCFLTILMFTGTCLVMAAIAGLNLNWYLSVNQRVHETWRRNSWTDDHWRWRSRWLICKISHQTTKTADTSVLSLKRYLAAYNHKYLSAREVEKNNSRAIRIIINWIQLQGESSQQDKEQTIICKTQEVQNRIPDRRMK
jgi:hypothetical protein